MGPGSRGNFGVFLPGGAYKSKIALFSGAAAFHLPTVSPLKASMICVIQKVLTFINILFTPQRDFNKAIGWWLETGIYAKMEDDVGRNKNWTTAWTKPSNRKREPLEMSHVQPLLLIFGAGIMASVIAFGFEFQSRPRMKEILRPHYESSKYTGNHL